ncbi:hypothetical protein DITRI_Ditri04bG0012400 [Diplodiscus trichospermus]
MRQSEPDSTNPDVTKAIAQSTSSAGSLVASVADECERLAINEMPVKYSPTCIAKPKSDQSVLLLSPPENNRQLDVNTTRILERLEPNQANEETSDPFPAQSGCGSRLDLKPMIRTSFQ